MFSSLRTSRRVAFRLVCRFAFPIVILLVMAAGSEAAGAQASSAPAENPSAAQAPSSQPPMTVQARIKMRREQRRASAIHDVYSHLYEAYIGAGYLRFTPGSKLERVNEYNWNVGFTRYYTERFGITFDGRGNYGSAYIGPNAYSNTAVYKPAISQYAGMVGPTYRFLLTPKYSLSGRVLGGGGYGNFNGDLGKFTAAGLGLYTNGAGAAASISVPFEYNVSPEVGLRLAPEYMLTTFGSEIQSNLGYTAGLVIRFGKQ